MRLISSGSSRLNFASCNMMLAEAPARRNFARVVGVAKLGGDDAPDLIER